MLNAQPTFFDFIFLILCVEEMPSFLLFNKYNKNDQSKDDEMGEPFNTHGRSQKYVRYFMEKI
jgi:hypothetical protein